MPAPHPIEALCDAITDVLFYRDSPPLTPDERRDCDLAVQLIRERPPIAVPGEDAAAWWHRLRMAGLECRPGPAGEAAAAFLLKARTVLNAMPRSDRLPAAVRNCFAARYLADPTPGPWPLPDGTGQAPIVFVPFAEFAAFVTGEGIDLLTALDAWRQAGWIEDVRVDLTPTVRPDSPPTDAIARLKLPPGRHRLVGIRPAALSAPAEATVTAPPEPCPAEQQRDEGGTAPADPYADLRRFARASLKGQERAVIETLCDAGGELPITDLALGGGVDWGGDSFQGFKNAQTRLSRKLKKIGWSLARRNNSALLRQTDRLERGLK